MMANRLIDVIRWEEYDEVAGKATHVGNSLRELLSAQDAAIAESAYWKLENHIVAQGTVYSSSVPATRVLVSGLLEDIPMPVRISILELLYQILSGVSSEPSRDLVSGCRALANEGLWLIVREFVYGPRNAAREVLRCLDTDLDYEVLIGR